MSITNTMAGFSKADSKRTRPNIPCASIVWATSDGNKDILTRNLGFIPQHASAATVDVKLRLRGDDSADVVTVNVNQEYSGDVAQIVASGTTATKIIIRV